MSKHFQGRQPPNPSRRADVPAATMYPIPADTRTALLAFRAEKKVCYNLGLLFDRYIGYLPGWRLDDKRTSPKKDALDHIRRTSTDGALQQATVSRWRAMVGDAVVFEGRPSWRFLTGLGRKGPLEVGFTFHSLYGLPIIPGSGLKGLAAAYAEWGADPKLTVAERAEVFGAQAQQGGAIFFDAIPAEPPTLELDVMNPHYPDYYQGTEPPAEWQSPQPVFFLTLGAGSRFLFAVGGPARKQAADWLRHALASMGAGAKTSAGYGYWSVE